jgi:hypothetical protein
MKTEIDVLYPLVSDAIWRAEQLEGDAAARAWAEVSILEDRVAHVIPHSDLEGRIARRGAVRAALKAGDPDRAWELVERYAAEPGAPEDLEAELREIVDAAERSRSPARRTAGRSASLRRYPGKGSGRGEGKGGKAADAEHRSRRPGKEPRG